TVHDPTPDFIACLIPRILPTVAPVPAPTAPSVTALSVAAAAAVSAISRVGRTPFLLKPRSYRIAPTTIGTSPPPVLKPTPLCSRNRRTPPADSRPNALPPENTTP